MLLNTNKVLLRIFSNFEKNAIIIIFWFSKDFKIIHSSYLKPTPQDLKLVLGIEE